MDNICYQPVVLRVTNFGPAGAIAVCWAVATTATFPTCGLTTEVNGQPWRGCRIDAGLKKQHFK